MTIRFITAWNGYTADKIVSGLSTIEEARMISLGFAVSDLDGPGNGSLPVMSSTDSNGGISLSAGNNSLSLVLGKIRASISAAEKLNSVEAQPWLPPTNLATGSALARANSTTYPVGTVVTNAAGTHQFIARISAGNTASSQPITMTTPLVTTTPFNMGDIVDGSVTWNWLGPVRTLTALADAPAVSIGALPAQLSKSNAFSNGVASSLPYPNFLFDGGIASTGAAASWQVFVRGASVLAGQRNNQFASGDNYVADFSSVTFMTDASYIALDMTTGAGSGGLSAGNPLVVEVDDRLLWDGNVSPISNVSAPNGFIILDWRASGGRKARKIRLSVGGNPALISAAFVPWGYGRFYTQPQDAVWLPENPNRFKIGFVGNSLSAGSNAGPIIAGTAWNALFGRLVGCDQVFSSCIGGTGFYADSSGSQLNYISRLADLVSWNPDAVYVFDAFNDQAYSVSNATQFQATILAWLQAVRAALPDALIIMSGTWGGTDTTAYALVEGFQKAAFAQFNDSNSFFIDVSTDTPTWASGTGTITAPNSSGNTDIYIGLVDAVHPSVKGIEYLAYRHANAFKSVINKMIF